jgi:hypothetical protein
MKFLTGGARSNALACGRGRKPCGGSDANDRGGQIGRYVDRFEKLRASGETIIIDGLCASACTIVLGTIPYDRICVTPNANLAFHAAWESALGDALFRTRQQPAIFFRCIQRGSDAGSPVAAA